METKSYRVVESEEKDLDKDLEVVAKKCNEQLKEQFMKIYSELDELTIQQKIFFLDRTFTEMILNSNLPQFYINGLMLKIQQSLNSINETTPMPEVKEVIKKDKSYIG